MKWLALMLVFFPCVAYAYLTGIDDVNPNLPPETQKILDDTIMGYYRQPTPEKVETVLDLMNTSKLLDKKTAWPPIIGFLTIVFGDNKEHLFNWMARNGYTLYAQDVFVAALLHAQLKETAVVFAQAHQWKKLNLNRLKGSYDTVDLKHLAILLPGHIDTLWCAFFASGNPIYVNEIIAVIFQSQPVMEGSALQKIPKSAFDETKLLATSSLRYYAMLDENVANIVKTAMSQETNSSNREYLEKMLKSLPEYQRKNRLYVAAVEGLGVILLLAAVIIIFRKKETST